MTADKGTRNQTIQQIRSGHLYVVRCERGRNTIRQLRANPHPKDSKTGQFTLIRELSRTEENIGAELHRSVNQLYQLLLRYYPQLLQFCATPDEPWLYVLLELAPTPERGAKLKLARIRQLLAKHRIRRWSAEEIADVLAAPALPLAPGSVEAASEHVLLLIPQLRLLATLRKQVAGRMEDLLDAMAASASDAPENELFRDVSLLRSLPGIGRVVTGAFLAEAAGPLRQRDYYAIRAHGGIAPVTRQSGKSEHLGMRYRCNSRLRNALHHWARTSVQHDSRSKQQYARLRAAGHSHGRALGGIADRLLTVLIAKLKTGQPTTPAVVPQPNRDTVARENMTSLALPPDGRLSAYLVHSFTAERVQSFPFPIDKRWGLHTTGTYRHRVGRARQRDCRGDAAALLPDSVTTQMGRSSHE